MIILIKRYFIVDKKMEQKIDLKELHCMRCGHNWTPRIPVVKKCAKCNSLYWNVKEVPRR